MDRLSGWRGDRGRTHARGGREAQRLPLDIGGTAHRFLPRRPVWTERGALQLVLLHGLLNSVEREMPTLLRESVQLLDRELDQPPPEGVGSEGFTIASRASCISPLRPATPWKSCATTAMPSSRTLAAPST